MARLYVDVIGNARGLLGALNTAERRITQFQNHSTGVGDRLGKHGAFASSAVSALGLSQYVDQAGAKVLQRFGVGGDAALAISSTATGLLDVALSSEQMQARIGSSVAKVAGKFQGLQTTIAGSKQALIGKAGLAGAAGLAAYQITKMGLEATGLDKKLEAAGAKAWDLATALGLANNPMAKYEGASKVTKGTTTYLRRRAARLMVQQGMTSEQAAARVAATHKGVLPSDFYAPTSLAQAKQILINGGIHLHGVQDVPALQEKLNKLDIGRPTVRRGGRG